jgi:hypothetical protein
MHSSRSARCPAAGGAPLPMQVQAQGGASLPTLHPTVCAPSPPWTAKYKVVYPRG